MTNSHLWQEPESDIEAIVYAAGNFVQTSDDLRARTLENARVAIDKVWATRFVRCVGALLLLLLLFAGAGGYQAKLPASYNQNWFLTASFNRPYSQSETNVSRSNMEWSMVEAFTELRLHQARVLRPTP